MMQTVSRAVGLSCVSEEHITSVFIKGRSMFREPEICSSETSVPLTALHNVLSFRGYLVTGRRSKFDDNIKIILR